MLPAERHRRIIAALIHGVVVGTDELTEALGVSSETVRRDLRTLEGQGKLIRVRGGATMATSVAGSEPAFVERAGIAIEAKRAIGRHAASLVRPGTTLMIDVGTTALEVARALAPDFHGTIATPSLLVAIELAGRPGVEVLISGGRVRGGDLAVSNSTALDFFADLWPDVAFLGSGGVDPAAGLTDYYLDEVAVRRLVLERASVSYVLADRGKHGRVAAHRVCGLKDFTGLITDSPPDARLAAALEEEGGQLLVAGRA